MGLKPQGYITSRTQGMFITQAVQIGYDLVVVLRTYHIFTNHAGFCVEDGLEWGKKQYEASVSSLSFASDRNSTQIGSSNKRMYWLM